MLLKQQKQKNGGEQQNRLKSLDVNTLTPIESMNILFELANMLK